MEAAIACLASARGAERAEAPGGSVYERKFVVMQRRLSKLAALAGASEDPVR
jgi:hypothetical protein